jgi:hypothetical protein
LVITAFHRPSTTLGVRCSPSSARTSSTSKSPLPAREDGPEIKEWQVEIVTIHVTSPNWNPEDRKRPWKGRDDKGRERLFRIDDKQFWRLVQIRELLGEPLDDNALAARLGSFNKALQDDHGDPISADRAILPRSCVPALAAHRLAPDNIPHVRPADDHVLMHRGFRP